MISLTADKKMVALLSQVKELAEIRDSSGHVIGFFAPLALPDAQFYANAAAHIDPAEIARRKAPGRKGYTTREVFEHLKSLTQDEQMRVYLQEKIDGLREREGCATP
jgi:hypothetical protein